MKLLRIIKEKSSCYLKWTITYLVPVLTLIVAIWALIVAKSDYTYSTTVTHREIIAIGQVYEDDFYFDGETLSKEISILITNNSYVPVSITSLSLQRGAEETYSYDTLSVDFLPLNLDASASELIYINYPFSISATEKNELRSQFGTDVKIDTYVYEKYLSDGIWVEPNPSIVCRPPLQIEIYTAKGTTATYARGGGAHATF